MHIDPFTRQAIQNSGIWTDSGCLDQEAETLARISSLLVQQGFCQDPDNQRWWHRGDQKIVLCLVDDIRSASGDYETDLPYLFDKNTTVITDNRIGCPTVFRVVNLPYSFFGIYSNDPVGAWEPDRDFCFSVNRIDDRRFKIMMELARVIDLAQGYVNFNCQRDFFPDGRIPAHQQLRANFTERFEQLGSDKNVRYSRIYERLLSQMPLRNYDITHEQIHLRSRCNIVIESYGSDSSVAFSEKIFRALVLPVPWTLYGGHYAVAWLESLGFDCASDLINHNHYDQLKEVEDKEHIFVWFTLKTIKEKISQEPDQMRHRLIQAADHNKELLRTFRDTWSADFQHWLADLDQTLTI